MMVQHQVYYRSTQYLSNDDTRETTPNAGRSKIIEIVFQLSADIELENYTVKRKRKRRTFLHASLRLSEDKKTAILQLTLYPQQRNYWKVILNHQDVTKIIRVTDKFLQETIINTLEFPE